MLLIVDILVSVGRRKNCFFLIVIFSVPGRKYGFALLCKYTASLACHFNGVGPYADFIV